MTELERITKNFDFCIESIQKEGIQTKSISLTLISQSLIEIAKELAIMNDRKEERKVGKWIKTGGSFRCSECMVMPEFKDIRTLKFCPNCGAEMRGSENEVN